MPELVGVWDPSADRDRISGILRRQLARAGTGYTGAAEHSFVTAGCGIGLVDPGIHENGPQPARSADGHHALVLWGELFNADELRRAGRGAIASGARSTPDLCLRMLAAEGVDAAARFDGQFAIAWFDDRGPSLTLITDRMGYRPIFHATTPAGMVFGSSLRAIAAVDPSPVEVDDVGVLELFCYGTHVFDRSWAKGYRRVPSATAVRWSASGATSRKYWHYRYDESAKPRDQATYVTVMAKLLDRAVERRMGGGQRIGIFLSGGYDSRAIAAGIREEHLPIPAFTFGVPESRDVRFASEMSRRLGFEFRHLAYGPDYLRASCRAIAWRNEGMVPFSHNTSILFHREIKERADIILTGFLGEYAGSHTWPRLLTVRSREAAIPVIFERMMGDRPATARRIFRPEFFEATFAELHDRFRVSFESIDNHHPMDVSDAWDFTFRHPWSYQPSSVDRHVFEVRAPQFDADLMAFMLAIPWHARIEQRVYKKMIAYAYPAIRDVPCTNSGRPIEPRFVREYARMVANYAARKAWAPVRALFTSREPLGRELTDLAEDFRRQPELISGVLRPLVDDGVFESRLFRSEGILELAAEHYDGRARHEGALARLITWGLARKYVADPRSESPPVLAGGSG